MSSRAVSKLAATYREQGFLKLDGFFPAAEMAEARAAVEEILRTDDLASVAELEPADRSVARRIWSPAKRHPLFERMAADPRLVDVVEELIGPDVLLHYTKLHLKAPRVGSVVQWHQDFSYYPHTNTDLVSAMVYLDDADAENACLRAIPGSHKRGIFDHYVDGYFRGRVENLDALDLPEPALLAGAAGTVLFIHCLVLHHSPPNRSDRLRRAFLPAYRAADAYPIHFGPHAGHNEPGIKLLRGARSRRARVEAASWLLPFPQAPFGSLFELQEGSHVEGGSAAAGYATRE